MAGRFAGTGCSRLLSTLHNVTEGLVRPVALADTPGENREN
jgi:hypothetical protein